MRPAVLACRREALAATDSDCIAGWGGGHFLSAAGNETRYRTDRYAYAKAQHVWDSEEPRSKVNLRKRLPKPRLNLLRGSDASFHLVQKSHRNWITRNRELS